MRDNVQPTTAVATGFVKHLISLLPRDARTYLDRGARYDAHAVPQSNHGAAGAHSVEPLHAFALIDQSMRFIQVSPVVAELTGYSAEELCCMGIQEIACLNGMEGTIDNFWKLDDHEWTHLQEFFYRKDGVKVEARIDAIRLMDGQVLAWIREICVKAGRQFPG